MVMEETGGVKIFDPQDPFASSCRQQVYMISKNPNGYYRVTRRPSEEHRTEKVE